MTPEELEARRAQLEAEIRAWAEQAETIGSTRPSEETKRLIAREMRERGIPVVRVTVDEDGGALVCEIAQPRGVG